MRFFNLIFFSFTCFAIPVLAQATDGDGDLIFHISELEKGQTVTLPRPATTMVPLHQEIRLASTDLPQNLQISLPPTFQKSQAIEIQIFDSFSDDVKTIKVTPGTVALYTFKALSSVRLVPKVTAKKNGPTAAQLKIESNKPLSVGL